MQQWWKKAMLGLVAFSVCLGSAPVRAQAGPVGARPGSGQPPQVVHRSAGQDVSDGSVEAGRKRPARDYKVVLLGGAGGTFGFALFVAPLLYAGIGVRQTWYEVEMTFMAVPRPLGNRDFFVQLGFGFFGYSVRKSWFRLRHGIELTVSSTIAFKRRVGPYFWLPMPGFTADLLGLQFRLARGLWLEFEPLCAGWGWPVVYLARLGLRWEI